MSIVYNSALCKNVYYTPSCFYDEFNSCNCWGNNNPESYCATRIYEDTLIKNVPSYWFRKHYYVKHNKEHNCQELISPLFYSKPHLANYYYLKAKLDYVEAERHINNLDIPTELMDLIKYHTKKFILKDYFENNMTTSYHNILSEDCLHEVRYC